jgi:hypothetical protein
MTTKYGKYFIREPFVKGQFAPKIAFFSSRYGLDINFGLFWNYISAPYEMPGEPHSHPFEEIWCFIGGDQTNIKDFGAEVELYLGEEGEKHIITSTTILEIPRGLVHMPLIFKKVDRPLLFVNIPLTPEYTKTPEYYTPFKRA